jgi:succinate dehydrogenase / fumarate reductase flavoprotein subunit
MQGVTLANLEMIQYHPTTIHTPSKRMLITEAARGEGGKLFVLRDGKPWYFMKEWYPEMAELMPRDVVSRSIYKASQGGENQVYLDITHLDDETVKVKLDEVYDVCMKYLKLDPTVKPIPVYPGVHYFMGGIKTDENHKTNIEGLFAAGECSCQYHGANRLGGNSLLGAIHGGCVAARNIVLNDYPINENLIDKKLDDERNLFESWNESSNEVSIEYIENQLSSIMNNNLGIYRNEEGLSNALVEIDDLNQYDDANGSYYDNVKIKSLLVLAKACLHSAIERKESRGAHQRIEYPETSQDYQKNTCVNFDGEIKITFEGFDE